MFTYRFFLLGSVDMFPMAGAAGGPMVSALDLRVSGPGLSPGRGHVVFLGETLYSHSASLHPGV